MACTIHLSDTHDSYKRTIMIARRNGKTTFVQRWKDRHTDKRHTQRFTMSDNAALAFCEAILSTVRKGDTK